MLLVLCTPSGKVTGIKVLACCLCWLLDSVVCQAGTRRCALGGRAGSGQVGTGCCQTPAFGEAL